jgi:hypothetical protein
MTDKKCIKLDTIVDDAPFGSINWYSISFITPQKIDKCLMFDVIGFKVHNGYSDKENAIDDVAKLRKASDLDNIYVCKMGAICAWDDDTYADEVEYGIKKLNKYEKSYREQQDKLDLVKKQLESEYNTKKTKTCPDNNSKIKKIRDRMRKKLYEKGTITKHELDALTNKQQPIAEALKNVMKPEEIMTEATNTFSTDYLDSNPPVAFKYGCISIYCPKKIIGLKTLCYKVRGLFETKQQAIKRAKKIQSMYPHDNLSIFTVGDWCPYSSNIQDMQILAPQLNLARKLYIDDIKQKDIEFAERAAKMTNENKKDVERQRQDNVNNTDINTDINTDVNTNVNTDVNTDVNTNVNTDANHVAYGTDEDTRTIIKIFEYLHEPRLLGKYKCTNSVRHQII